MYLYIIIIEWEKNILPEATALQDLISANFTSISITENSYLVLSNNSSVEIRNYIVNNIKHLNRIYVGEMSTTAAWKNAMSDSDEIKEMFNHD